MIQSPSNPEALKRPAIGVAIGATDVAVSVDGSSPNGTYRDAPPAALLPLVRGEAIVASAHQGIDQLGTAMSWPSVGQVEEETGSGRCPAAYAWRLLEQAESNWLWKHNGTHHSITGADAIAAIAHGNLPTEKQSRASVALVVPNSLDMGSQEELLRRLRARRLREPLLLWRPVAAALAWLEEYKGFVPRANLTMGRPFGEIACVHLGADTFEADVLEIIPVQPASRVWLLPARSQPGIPTLYDVPMGATEYLAGETATSLDTWQLLWATNWLRGEICHGHDPSAMASDPTTGALRVHRRSPGKYHSAVSQSSLNSSLRAMRRAWGVGTSPLRRLELDGDGTCSFDDWLKTVERAPSRADLLGIVVTGEHAAHWQDHNSLAGSVLARLTKQNNKVHVLAEEQDTPVGGVLARGASIFMHRHLRDQPTYLDTLPVLETLVIRKGEPSWENLVAQEDHYVPGAKKRVFDPPVAGLRILHEERALTLSVFQEGFESVREIKEEIRSKLEQDVPVRLRVEITAGQGNPRVQVLPVQAHDLHGQRVYLDWNRATDTRKTKEQIADAIPRTNPPLDPRQCSYDCWLDYYGHELIVPLLKRSINLLERPRLKSLEEAAHKVYRSFWSRDGSMRKMNPPVHATAFDSDGRYPSRAGAYQLVRTFETKAMAHITGGTSDKVRQNLIRALGYMSSNYGIFLKYLSRSLSGWEDESAEDRKALLIACGNCLRDPGDIAQYAQTMVDELVHGRLSGPSYWMRALCQMMRYREDAAKAISSETCQRLAWHCYKVAREQVESQDAVKILYWYGSLSVAFLLRRRRYDDSYMDPQHWRSREIKSFLRKTIEGMRNGSIAFLSGVVDPIHVTQMIIDYIDRKGRGLLVVED